MLMLLGYHTAYLTFERPSRNLKPWTFTELLSSRRTVHKLQPGPVPAAIVDKAFEAAHWAPNHKLTLPWRFTVIGPEARSALCGNRRDAQSAKGRPAFG